MVDICTRQSSNYKFHIEELTKQEKGLISSVGHQAVLNHLPRGDQRLGLVLLTFQGLHHRDNLWDICFRRTKLFLYWTQCNLHLTRLLPRSRINSLLYLTALLITIVLRNLFHDALSCVRMLIADRR